MDRRTITLLGSGLGVAGVLAAAVYMAHTSRQTGPGQVGPEQVGPEQAGPGQAGPAQTGPVQAEADQQQREQLLGQIGAARQAIAAENERGLILRNTLANVK